ncbi:hypothetical protein FCOIX_143 [Fusarium coicis]|nr:hypothetical protein FCOIX_143 [Fusarium coicis]
MADMKTVLPEPVIEGVEEPEKASHASRQNFSTGNRTSISSKALWPVKKLDAFISRLNRLMHTRESHDALILFLAYAAHFVATALETPIPDRLKSWLVRFNKILMRIVPPRLKSLLSICKGFPTISSSSTKKPLIAERFRALSDILDDWQIITRLWGLLATWAEAKEFLANLSSENEIEEKKSNPRKYLVLTAIRATYLLGLFGYYGTENLAWLTRRGVFKWSEKTESKLMIWSLKAWGIYVMSGIAQLLIVIEVVEQRAAVRGWSGFVPVNYAGQRHVHHQSDHKGLESLTIRSANRLLRWGCLMLKLVRKRPRILMSKQHALSPQPLNSLLEASAHMRAMAAVYYALNGRGLTGSPPDPAITEPPEAYNRDILKRQNVGTYDTCGYYSLPGQSSHDLYCPSGCVTALSTDSDGEEHTLYPLCVTKDMEVTRYKALKGITASMETSMESTSEPTSSDAELTTKTGTTAESKTQETTSPAESSSNSSAPTGAIVGGVLGGLAIFALIGLGLGSYATKSVKQQSATHARGEVNHQPLSSGLAPEPKAYSSSSNMRHPASMKSNRSIRRALAQLDIAEIGKKRSIRTVSVTAPQKLKTLTITKTITETAVTTPTFLKTDTTVYTTTSTLTSTVTVPTVSGFIPLASVSGFVSRKRSQSNRSLLKKHALGDITRASPLRVFPRKAKPKHKPKALEGPCTIQIEPGDKNFPVKPTQSRHVVACYRSILVTKTKGFSSCIPWTKTITLDQKTILKQDITRGWLTTTVTEADTTMTADDTATTTSTLTKATTTKTFTETETVTRTDIAPAESSWAACNAENLINAANGGHGINAVNIGKNVYNVHPLITPYDCCVECQKRSNCIFSVAYHPHCYLVIGTACVPGHTFDTSFTTLKRLLPENGATLSNGPCGRLVNAGDIG